jgi:transcriptional regulator with XRE-family HTH domain
MINSQILGSKIKDLREEKNITQEELAKIVGVGRVAISQIEQGKRSVEFLELAKIAEFFHLKLEYFLSEDSLPDIKPDHEIMHDFIPEKLRSIILYILERCAGKTNIGETMIYKMLYFIDFDFYEIYGRTITGLSYIHLQFGPVPMKKQYLSVVGGMESNKELKIITQDYFGMRIKRYINLFPYETGKLDPIEAKTVDNVINSMSDWSAKKIEDYVHGDAPWYLTKEKELIPYNLVFNRSVPYSKKGEDCLDLFSKYSGADIIKGLGPISKEEADYYDKI